MSLNEHHGAIIKPSQHWKVDPSIYPEDDGVYAVKQKVLDQEPVTGEVVPTFVQLQCRKDRFFKLKYSCEKIQGILTICEEDITYASVILDKQLFNMLSASTVHIYTTDQFRHHFDGCSKVKSQHLSTQEVMEKIKEQNEFSLIVVDISLGTKLRDVLKTSFGDTSNTAVLGVTCELVGECSGDTAVKIILKQADCLLARSAIAILKTVHLNLQLYESRNSLSELEKSSLLDVYDFIKSAFERSGIPSSELPEIPIQTSEYPSNIDKAIAVITCQPAIIGCLKKHGTLQIYVNKPTADLEVEENIRRELEKHSVTKYAFLYGQSTELYSSGDSTFGGHGTLGGFIQKEIVPSFSLRHMHAHSLGSSNNAANRMDHPLVALVSSHVVRNRNAEFLIVGTNRIGRIGNMRVDETIDILPVDIDPAFRHLCDLRFRTEMNVSMFSKLRTTEEIQPLRGEPVHLWSAKSDPGLGIFVEQEFITSNGLRIIVRDRRRRRPFAQEGDSGAMICYFDAESESLYAVAMLITKVELGQDRGTRYTAQILDDGLQKLSIKNDCRFSLFDDDSE